MKSLVYVGCGKECNISVAACPNKIKLTFWIVYI